MIQISKFDCCGCMACMKKCPSDAIMEKIDSEVFAKFTWDLVASETKAAYGFAIKTFGRE